VLKTKDGVTEAAERLGSAGGSGLQVTNVDEKRRSVPASSTRNSVGAVAEKNQKRERVAALEGKQRRARVAGRL
jgi:hypothetical protein